MGSNSIGLLEVVFQYCKALCGSVKAGPPLHDSVLPPSMGSGTLYVVVSLEAFAGDDKFVEEARCSYEGEMA